MSQLSPLIPNQVKRRVSQSQEVVNNDQGLSSVEPQAQKKYECDKCQYMTSNKKQLDEHMRSNHFNIDKYECDK